MLRWRIVPGVILGTVIACLLSPATWPYPWWLLMAGMAIGGFIGAVIEHIERSAHGNDGK